MKVDPLTLLDALIAQGNTVIYCDSNKERLGLAHRRMPEAPEVTSVLDIFDTKDSIDDLEDEEQADVALIVYAKGCLTENMTDLPKLAATYIMVFGKDVEPDPDKEEPPEHGWEEME